jgi:hypothetical protein
MRLLIAASALLVAFPMVASAQTGKQHKGEGFVFFGSGVTADGEGTVHFGGGGQGFVYRGLGLGAEIGYLAPWSSFNDGVAAGAVNLSYHLLPRSEDKKVEPFMTAGYLVYARAGVSSGFNWGGGVSLWLGKRAGLRLEVRDQFDRGHSDYFQSSHVIDFRVGLTFR